MALVTPSMVTETFGCDLFEVARARHFVRDALHGYPENTVYLAMVCVSEMVTNAIKHSDTKRKGGEIVVVVVPTRDRVRIEVLDHGSDDNTPEIIENINPAEDEHGRGMLTIGLMSEAWGEYVDEARRAVWCEVVTHET
jgi:anti-sigma regulatory factor (Ser/Thr protein kinase)